MNMYFPSVYDIKHLIKFCNGLYGVLSKVANKLNVKRIGVCHQAGSDSLLTSDVFTKLAYVYFNGLISTYAGVLYGYQSFYWAFEITKQQIHAWILISPSVYFNVMYIFKYTIKLFCIDFTIQ